MSRPISDGHGGYTYEGLPMPPQLDTTGVQSVFEAWDKLQYALTVTIPGLVRRLAYDVVSKSGG